MATEVVENKPQSVKNIPLIYYNLTQLHCPLQKINGILGEVIGLYADRIYTVEETLKRLRYMKPNDQVSFHTKKAVDCLKLLKRIEWN
ncbi:MAG: DUF3990 domain-containing protein [Planctomycetaceae bacterium]|nr:DUF3990 domain-containing protein [Planctomycetaceae bacterium]